MIGYGVLVAVLALVFGRVPTGFLPQEDQGLMYAQVVLPPGSTMEQTRQVLARVTDHLLTNEKDAIETARARAPSRRASGGSRTAQA